MDGWVAVFMRIRRDTYHGYVVLASNVGMDVCHVGSPGWLYEHVGWWYEALDVKKRWSLDHVVPRVSNELLMGHSNVDGVVIEFLKNRIIYSPVHNNDVHIQVRPEIRVE